MAVQIPAHHPPCSTQLQRGMKKPFLLLTTSLVLAFNSLTASAQGVPTIEDLKKVTDAAMEKVGKGDVEGGMKAFRHLTLVPKSEFDTMLGQTMLQLPMLTGRFGASLGHEFIEEKRVGASLVRLTYIHKFDVHATRWYFFGYRGKDGWAINTFRFDDKVQDMF
ncbi:hypothetical protein [Hydrogenophaga pseudoflava]|uniref:hypothetical protein n=1 Tax=Hydrogenophaga pseudoflava TaxID=47421 RepID=UPI0027E42FD8|nr:hypothetical protein [Hydrogenophaga pseudoflava]MDQ7743357.1 hypothetical protein [Hydrogenophaga pseudoflava]